MGGKEKLNCHSFQDCYAAEVAFRPSGDSIQPAAYAALTLPQPGPEVSAALASCPPAAAAGCPDFSGYASWQSLYGTATAGSDVVVSGSVVLHGCAQPRGSVSLVVGDSPLSITFERLIVNGTFSMGTPACPIASGITVNVPGGNEQFGVDNAGSYDVHGVMQGLTWTRIAATVPAGATSMRLQEAVQWQRGDQILLVTTTWKGEEELAAGRILSDELANQNEVLTVAAVSADGRTVTTQQTIQFNHYGVEYQAEVALLTRRILFTSDATSASTGIGPHTTSTSPAMRISGAAFQRWGARNRPGRYAIHYHLAGDAPAAYVRNVAVYSSNWRCITLHGTNDVTLSGNVGFNVPGHCYYLEDGVEERNVLERNLAAYVHPIQTAGSGGGQVGTDRWQSATLFDPSDSGASGFYSLNAYNTWLNNAASGGFSGFTFPRAPRAIKDHRTARRPDGRPFDPSERPFLLFSGNSAHSTGYFWEHNAAVYIGGMLFYKTDPADGQVKLFYNNGRGSIKADTLCPDPQWPDSDGSMRDCWIGSARSTKTADGAADGYLVLQDTTAALANVGITSWGDRVEVHNLRGFDLSRGSEYLGQSFMKDSFFRRAPGRCWVNTTNSVKGWSQWPFSSSEYYWNSQVIKGFEWYDTTTTTILSNITFDNYKHIKYTDDPEDWWSWQTPSAFRMLSHSDQFKPDKTMMVTKGITCSNCDMGRCSGSTCTGGAFFRVDETYRGSSWFFNWLDLDGSVVRHVRPALPGQPYLIGSQPDWWRLDDAASWREPRFNSPWAAARVEMRVANNGQQYTVGAFDGQDSPASVTQGGWYAVWNVTGSGFHAPKRLELILFNVPRNKAVLWSSCWPAGTAFMVSKTFDFSGCQDVDALTPVSSRAALLASGGNNFWVDANSCLHLKLTDPGHPWQYTNNFQRDGMYVEEPVRWYDLRYVITTNMACADNFFCPLPGNPASRVPPAVAALPPTCLDVQPPDATCGSVQCGWALAPGCSNPDVISKGFCQVSG
ncbi:hypothetical protein COO60DRAFT_1669869 [Scenedesmus sp. NREL 46B-D3]|nr:hypothetical protein COO60DRAFT_1669869 [Scenedesmus sp. NREL 46B-D3]